MDNYQIPDEGLNLDEWEQVQSPSLRIRSTRSPSREWDMAAIRDNYLQDSVSFFPPSQHEGLQTITQDQHEVPNSPSSASSLSLLSNGLATDNSSSSAWRPRFENLRFGIVRIAAKFRYHAAYIGGFCSFASVTGVVAAVLLAFVYAKVRRTWRRKFQEENNRLIVLVKEKDEVRFFIYIYIKSENHRSLSCLYAQLFLYG